MINILKYAFIPFVLEYDIKLNLKIGCLTDLRELSLQKSNTNHSRCTAVQYIRNYFEQSKNSGYTVQ